MKGKLILPIAIIAVFGLLFNGCSKAEEKIDSRESSLASDTEKKESMKKDKASDSKKETGKPESIYDGTASAKRYADGVYEGKSEETAESYYATARVTIQDSKIKSVEVKIIDGDVSKRISYSEAAMDQEVLKKLKGIKERVFDESYGPEMFPGEGGSNPHYREQCKNDLAGLKGYSEKLVSEQDINKVDTVTGATWSNLLFKGAVLDALQKAEKK
ncbi:MAG: FMN-binding protein [Clostridia bacterium]|nr:FMN-binding protein [Clostridia bacterium]